MENFIFCADMCSYHACENSTEIKMSDEALDNEDDYGSDNKED